MVRMHKAALCRIAICALIGMASGTPHIGLGGYAIFPILWGAAATRREAFLSSLAFYLTSSRGVFIGAPIFFGDEGFYKISGLLLWIGSALSLSMPWTLLWIRSATPVSKGLRLFAIFVLLALPPLGMWGWSNPLLAAGYLLPGLGLFGLISLFALWAYLYHQTDRPWRRMGACAAIMLLIAIVAAASPLPAASDDWHGARTSFGRLYSGSDETVGIYRRYTTLRDIADSTTAKYVVLPETVAGWWGDATESLWNELSDRYERDGRTYFVGAEVWETPTRYRNVVQIRGANHSTFTQRYPVPVAMWRPWSEGGAVSDIFGSGVVEIDDMRVGILICFEPYLFMPCFLTMLNDPDVLVVPSNSWWARETSLPAHSDQCVESWSRLFGVPAVIAKNL